MAWNRKMCSVAHRAFRTLVLTMAVLVPRLAFAAEIQASRADPADDTLLALLTAIKYVAVPIDLTDPTRPIIHGQVNGTPADFVIDSATTRSSLRRDIVEELKLPITVLGKIKVSRPHTSGVIERATTTVERLKLGDVEIPHCQLDVDDSLDGLDPAVRQKVQHIDPWVGIIGDDTLAPNQCVVDLRGGYLYVRRQGVPPERRLRHELTNFFAAEKYVEVPCKKMMFPCLVDCQVGKLGHLSLMVDTGSRHTKFDHGVAVRFGFEGTVLPSGQGPVNAPGAKPTTSGPLPAPLILPSGFQIPVQTQVLAYDFTVGNRGLNRLGLPSADGSIGVDLLRRYSAVIDYMPYEPRLFLIEPRVRDRRLLVGKWEGVALEVSGRQMAIEDAKKCRLAIAEDFFDMQVWTGRRLKLTIDAMGADTEPKTLNLSIAGRDGMQSYPAIYDISRDQLRICLPLDAKSGEKLERPKEFKSPLGTPYAVFTFRRIQAE